MKEQFITFETAKLAKEKGFRLLVDFESSYPTQSLLQKWLREKHEVIVIINNWYNQPVDGIIYRNCFQPIINCEPYVDILCDTYEEALEKGLQEALKLIEL